MKEKIALITGVTAGIGKAIALRLAREGYALIGIGRREERLKELAAEIGTPFYPVVADVRNRSEVENFVNTLPEDWKKVDVLVNNAGLASGLASIEDGNIDDWERMIDTNIKGLLYVTSLVVPLMIAQGAGHIVNIGSIAGKEIYAMGNVYCATKHAVDALNRSMRLDLSKYPIKVSSISPGAVETEFSIVRFHGDEARAAKVYEGFDNLLAEDIADAAWYILSRPARVNINDMIVMPTAQPMAGVIHRV